jgi:Ca2+-transporting ATPase
MVFPAESQTPPLRKPWHTYTIDKTLQLLQTNSESGLTQTEFKQRLEKYGLNEIEESAGRSSWDIFLDQFKNIMLIMLIGVAIISGILDLIDLKAGVSQGGLPFKDTIAIMLIVILNGILGYLQESKAEKALAALKQMSSPQVEVIREGQRLEVKAQELVPGDIILLEAGDQLCADGLILDAQQLKIRESALTGEANPVKKSPSKEGLAEDLPLGDRQNMVFTGTEVINGRGKAVVTNTGMNTELGKIAQMLQGVKNEPTPLQQRMSQLGKVLVTGSLALVLFVVVFGTIQAGNFSRLQQLVEVSLSMAVAVVPEGLPAVITVTLALGTQRMVRRNALIRKLPAVETLGSVDTICSDKTGTLTQNKMVVQEVQTAYSAFQVTGEGYNPTGEFLLLPLEESNGPRENLPAQIHAIEVRENSELKNLLLTCVLCNDASLTQTKGRWEIIGDPTEGALLALAGKAGLNQDRVKQQLPRMAEIPFSSERKRMSIICANQSKQIALADFVTFTKGSPELILDRCQSYQLAQEILPLREKEINSILETNNEMASRGLRVLALAYKPLTTGNGKQFPLQENGMMDQNSFSEEEIERDLVWLGLVGMLDAPRPEVQLAVADCRSAGIRPVMITGDHQLTAKAIAQKLGIIQTDDLILTGKELSKLSQAELEEQVEQVSVYARVAPEHKLRIVQALQKRGKLVAMTGDGVNDAPALKQAEIGIAMGITGTDVSKEASEMVLLDDNFATIVSAVAEGRVVYSNIRKFIKYILGSNIGEVITIASAPFLGLPDVPLTPLQILWMNLVTDGVPALALAIEPAAPDVMKHKPFSSKESIFARGLGFYMLRIGLIFSIITICLMIWSYQEAINSANVTSWKTMVFTTLCIAQMGHALAVRSDNRLTIEMNLFSNPYLLVAISVTVILQLMLIYVPFLRNFFGTDFLTGTQLLICLGFSSLVFVWVELEKLLIRIIKKV